MMTYPLAKAALPYILETYANGRAVTEYQPGQDYNPGEVYLLVTADGYTAAPKLADMGFQPFTDYYDQSNPYMWGLPIDWEYRNARIGRCSFYNSVEFDFAAGLFFESVGRYCSINETAYFQHDHPMNMTGTGRFQQLMSRENQMRYFQRIGQDPRVPNKGEKLVIGNDVWIGAYAFINVSRCRSIGDGAIIAAGAVVNSDVPPYAVVAGVPARVKKYRYTPAQIETLLRVRWWDWDGETMDRYADELLDPEAFFRTFG